MKKLFLAVAAVCLSTGATAQSVKTTVQTSMGIAVTKWVDEFADRYEYASPDVTFEIPRGFSKQTASVSLLKKAGARVGPRILVMVAYSGEWQFYNSAILKGGEELEFTSGSRQVLSCRNGCTMIESFFVTPTKAQLAKYAADGTLTFQVRSKAGTAAVVTLPMAYYAAVEEAAK